MLGLLEITLNSNENQNKVHLSEQSILNLKSDAKLSPKTKLFLQPGFQGAVKNADGKKNKVHQVGPKEGLYSIARTYNVTVLQLKEWNNLDSDNLKIGQEIIVSK